VDILEQTETLVSLCPYCRVEMKYLGDKRFECKKCDTTFKKLIVSKQEEASLNGETVVRGREARFGTFTCKECKHVTVLKKERSLIHYQRCSKCYSGNIKFSGGKGD
jgi:ribosomal protein L37AE/L43A